MDEVRNEVVEEAMTEKIKLKQSGQHKDLQEFLEYYGEGASAVSEKKQYISRKKILRDLYLTDLDPDIERIVRSWPKSLALFLKPKHFNMFSL